TGDREERGCRRRLERTWPVSIGRVHRSECGRVLRDAPADADVGGHEPTVSGGSVTSAHDGALAHIAPRPVDRARRAGPRSPAGGAIGHSVRVGLSRRPSLPALACVVGLIAVGCSAGGHRASNSPTSRAASTHAPSTSPTYATKRFTDAQVSLLSRRG